MFLKRRRFDCGPAVLAALVLGLVTGAADAAFMYFVWGGTWKIPYLNPLFWLWVPLMWVAVLVGVALLFSLPYLRRLLIPALVVSGPGVLLLGRGASMLRDLGVASTGNVAATWLATIAILSLLAVWLFEVQPARFSRATAAVACAWVVLAGGIVALASNRPVQQPITASAKSAGPNVVIIFVDTVRYDDTGLYPGSRTTPNLVRFASQSIEFNNAWAPAPWTLPSHSAVYTGVEPWRSAVGSTTMAERLSRAGYDTAAIFANPLLNPSVDFTRGLQHVTYSLSSAPCQSAIGHLLLRMHENGMPVPRVCGWMLASEVTARAKAYVEKAPRPYFLTVNYFDAHLPYYVPKECADIPFKPYTRADLAAAEVIEKTRIPLSDAASSRLRKQHHAALDCMDRSLGSLMETLQKQPDYANTIVAILADHGEQFGKHFRFGHGNSVYRQVLHVPFVLRMPGRAPARIDAPVTITDLYNTVIQAVRLDRTPHTELALFDPAQRHLAIAEYLDGPPGTESFSAADDRHHLIVKFDQHQELYDYKADPTEGQPLDGTHRRRIGSLHDQLQRVRTQWNGERHDIPTFRGLGYLE